MSIFKKDTKIKSFPAFDIFTRQADSYGRVNVSAGDQLIDGSSTYYVSSVVSCALESNQCPIEAIEHAKTNNHQLYWIGTNPICISNSEIVKENMLQVDFDAIYRLEGQAFKIVPANNGNLGLEWIEAAPL